MHPTHRGWVVVTGAGGALGRRVLELLEADPAVKQVLGLDLVVPADESAKVRHHAVDLATGDLADPVVAEFLAAAPVLVHLAFFPGGEEEGFARANVESVRRVLEAAHSAEHLVVVSSATVYGAWPFNQVPLTEEEPVRPNPGFGYAAQKAEIERMCGEWSSARPGTTLALLRPAMALGDGEEGWLARALRATSRIRSGDENTPVQFVHLDDLASAVELARRNRLDGAYNVAADGWVTSEDVRALAGAPPRIWLPPRLVAAILGWAWRWRLSRTPPGLVPYSTHPWVVANDRLKANGWVPTHSNEEAFVAGHRGTPWSRLSPKRRQELTLGTAVATLGAAVAGVALIGTRLRRKRVA